MTIPELLPAEAYENHPPLSPVRIGLAMGMMGAVLGFVVSVLFGERDSVSLFNQVLEALFVGLVLGVWSSFPGLVYNRRFMRRVYRADPAIVPPAPAGSYDRRLACYIMLPSSSMWVSNVGGHLYFGRETWTFVPHLRNDRENRAPLSIPATPPPVVEVVDPPMARLTWLAAKAPIRHLQIRTSAATARFHVPDPEGVAAWMREYQQHLRRTA